MAARLRARERERKQEVRERERDRARERKSQTGFSVPQGWAQVIHELSFPTRFLPAHLKPN